MRCVSCTSSYIDGLSKRAIVFCAAMALMLISCMAFIQDNKFFGSAPKEAREVIIITPRRHR